MKKRKSPRTADYVSISAVCGYLGYQDMQKPWIVEKVVAVEEFANSKEKFAV